MQNEQPCHQKSFAHRRVRAQCVVYIFDRLDEGQGWPIAPRLPTVSLCQTPTFTALGLAAAFFVGVFFGTMAFLGAAFLAAGLFLTLAGVTFAILETERGDLTRVGWDRVDLVIWSVSEVQYVACIALVLMCAKLHALVELSNELHTTQQ